MGTGDRHLNVTALECAMAGMDQLIRMQKGEITEHYVYAGLAGAASGKNRDALEKISADELRHYGILKSITHRDFGPDRILVSWHTFLANTFGLSFALRLMENGERGAQSAYAGLAVAYPQVRGLIEDEEKHEVALLGMISEERLEYASSIVLGLNDALVELTGALAGLTLAFQDGKFIAVSGLVIGVAAALSMAASSYLSAMEDKEKGKKPLRSAVYTGVTYAITVLLLIAPYFIIPHVYLALATMIAITLLLIAAYTFYISTAKGLNFLPRFARMALISLTVTAISFGIGFAARSFFGLGV